MGRGTSAQQLGQRRQEAPRAEEPGQKQQQECAIPTKVVENTHESLKDYLLTRLPAYQRGQRQAASSRRHRRAKGGRPTADRRGSRKEAQVREYMEVRAGRSRKVRGADRREILRLGTHDDGQLGQSRACPRTRSAKYFERNEQDRRDASGQEKQGGREFLVFPSHPPKPGCRRVA